MKINTTGTHIELTDSIRDYLDKKLRGLEEFVDNPQSEAVAHVELGKISNHHKSGDIFRSEINIQVNGKQFRAVSETEDLYNSIDEMKDEIIREVKRQKDKRQSMIRRGGHKVKDMMHGIFRRNK